MRPSWPWSYGSWIYKIRVRCTTLYDIVCQCLATGWWFSPGPPVSSTNKTDRHYITEILLKVALNTINQTNNYLCNQCISPLMLRVRISIRARCTWYNIMWKSLSVTCDRSVVVLLILQFPPPIKLTAMI